MKIKFLVVCSLLALSGCGESPVSRVKNTYIGDSRTTTVDNALGHRKLCKEIKWENFKDEKGREIVQYSCHFVDGKDFERERRENYIEETTGRNQVSLQDAIESLEKERTALVEDFPDLRERLAQLEAFEAKLESGTTEKSPKTLQLEALLVKLEGYSGAYDDKKMLELSRSSAMGELGYGGYVSQTKIDYMNSLPPEKVQKYKSQEIDGHLMRLYSSLGEIKRSIDQKIAWENRQSGKESIDKLQGVKAQKSFVIDLLDRERRQKRHEIASREKNLEEVKAAGSEESIKAEALKRFPVYEDTVEIFQWIVNKEKISTLSYGEILVQLGDGKSTQLLKYNRPINILILAAQSNAGKTEAYLDEIRNHAILDMLTR